MVKQTKKEKKPVVAKSSVTDKSKTSGKADFVKNFAVIETGGKQYLVKPGDKIKIEKIARPEGDIVSLEFDKVLLLVKGAVIQIGTPYLDGVKVPARWIAEKRARKITNVKYKSKTRQSRKQGHRQIYTEVLIGDF